MSRRVLVTGASSGFGQEIALYLAERGCRVYASMRDLARRADLERAAQSRKVDLRVLQLDVTAPDSVERAIRVMADEGGIDAVVNNAGVLIRGYFEDVSDDEARDVFETNLFGAMAVTRAALAHMRQARRGRIVFITSVAGRIGAPSGSVYSASKFALEGFAESLMQEIAPFGLHVSIVEPGITKTESWTIDHAAARGARDPNSPYADMFKRAEHLFDRALQSSPIIKADVAGAVYRALAAERPRLRYVVGRRAALAITARRYVPERIFDRVYFGEVMRRTTGGRRPRAAPLLGR